MPETTTKKRIETIGGVLFQKAKKELKIKTGKKRLTKVGAVYSASSQKQLSISGAEELSMLSATATHKGTKTVTLKVGDTVVLLKDGVIKIETKKDIALKVSGSNDQGAGKSEQI